MVDTTMEDFWCCGISTLYLKPLKASELKKKDKLVFQEEEFVNMSTNFEIGKRERQM